MVSSFALAGIDPAAQTIDSVQRHYNSTGWVGTLRTERVQSVM
jgi:hypothetical protein